MSRKLLAREKTNRLTAERLREVLYYNSDTGAFTFQISVGNKVKGSEANCKLDSKANTYTTIAIDKERYLAHRLAWLYQTGQWPSKFIDHIDGDKSNNRWSNLREASASENKCNIKARSDNQLGLKGVSPCGNKYRAVIHWQGKQINLGVFGTSEEAYEVYKIASKQYHGEFGRS
jgi:hypothetical protein